MNIIFRFLCVFVCVYGGEEAALFKSNGKCLETKTIHAEVNAVFMADCNAAVTQLWKYNDETKAIISMFNNHCLHANAVDVLTFINCDSRWRNQQWLFQSEALKSVYYNKCMNSTDDGSVLGDCNDNDISRWELIPTFCYSAFGDPSGSYDDFRSTAICCSGYQLVSCGTSGSTTGLIDGSFIDDGVCYAQMGGTSAGENVHAVARCCAFDITCTKRGSMESGSNKGDLTDASCEDGETLTGCTAHTNWKNIDGAYPSDRNIANGGWSDTFSPFTESVDYTPSKQRCTAQNAGGGVDPSHQQHGVWAHARCCRSNNAGRYKWKCGAIKSYTADYTATVNCPSGWVLTGCSAISWWHTAAMWYTHGEQCIARAKDDSEANKGVWAVAICCKVIDTTENSAKQIENEKRLIDDDVRFVGFDELEYRTKEEYRDNNGNISRIAVIVSSLSVLTVFFILELLAMVYYCVGSLCNESRYTVIEEQDTECEA